MASTYVLKVLIVEDELIIAETLRQMLADMGHACAAMIDTFEEAKSAVTSNNFDLAILDINLDGNHEGIELGRQCHELGKPFLFLTSYSDYETVLAAKASKPGAYLIKPFTPQDILVAIEMSLMHSNKLSDGQFEQVLKQLDLSERETQVLTCLKDRMTNSAIAEKLYVSKDTVKFHIKNLYIKLGVASRPELLEKLEQMV